MQEFDAVIYMDEAGQKPIWTCPMTQNCGYIIHKYYCSMKTLVEYFEEDINKISIKMIPCEVWKRKTIPYA